MKHTSGPWYRSIAFGKCCVQSKSGINICSWSSENVLKEDQETVEANARLIAAAPDMLDRLERFHNDIQSLIERSEQLPPLEFELELAEYVISYLLPHTIAMINKARGE